ncbi:MAG: hypothetical protein M1835_001543, partial [Candelina submexicana]
MPAPSSSVPVAGAGATNATGSLQRPDPVIGTPRRTILCSLNPKVIEAAFNRTLQQEPRVTEPRVTEPKHEAKTSTKPRLRGPDGRFVKQGTISNEVTT